VGISSSYSELQRIRSGLEELDSDLAEQVGQILRQEQDKEGFVKKVIEQILMFRNNEIQRQVYETSKAQSETNLKQVEEELESAVNELTEDVSG